VERHKNLLTFFATKGPESAKLSQSTGNRAPVPAPCIQLLPTVCAHLAAINQMADPESNSQLRALLLQSSHLPAKRLIITFWGGN